MREKQPRLLVIWGKYELSFDSRSRKPIAGTYQRPRFTFSTGVISRWIPRQTKLPQWFGASRVEEVLSRHETAS